MSPSLRSLNLKKPKQSRRTSCLRKLLLAHHGNKVQGKSHAMEKQTASCEVLPEKKISFNGHVEGFRPQSEGLEILLKPIARRNN